MKSLRRIMILLLLAVTCFDAFLLPVSASYMEHEGLEITIEMDKEVYDAGEPITATITVKNTNNGTSTISNLEQLIPEGYRLAESSEASMQNITLRAGQAIVMNVTFVEDMTAQENTESENQTDFLTKLTEGETLGIPNLLWALLLAIGFVIFMLLT